VDIVITVGLLFVVKIKTNNKTVRSGQDVSWMRNRQEGHRVGKGAHKGGGAGSGGYPAVIRSTCKVTEQSYLAAIGMLESPEEA
jgi:hypothetical protein